MANMPKRFTPSPRELTSNSWLVVISGGSKLERRALSVVVRSWDTGIHALNCFKDNEDRYQNKEYPIRKTR